MGCSCSRGSSQTAKTPATRDPPTQQGASDKAAAPEPVAPAAGQAPEPMKMEEPSPTSNNERPTTEDTASPDASPSTPAIDAAGGRAPSAPVIHDGAMSPPADQPRRRERPAQTVPSSLFTGVNHNGFKTIPEIMAITCTEENMAPHTLPAAALNFSPPDDAVVSRFKNGDQERKIHCNMKLGELELERLQAMRSEAKVQGMEFYPSVTAMATRFLSRARMDPKKALLLMQATHDWRKEFFRGGPIADTSIKEDMKHGIVYFSGRDYCLRPVIIIRAKRIPEQWYRDRCIDKFIKVLIFCMEYFLRYMVVPGRVENLSVIVDLAGLGISQVPLGPLGEVYKVMSHHYIGRVFKFFVVNMSSGLSLIAGMAKAILTDRQKQKLNMLDDVKELGKEFAAHHLEQDLGGSRPVFTDFLPFSLNPGPYEAGYTGAIDTGAVSNVHEVLSHAGAMGRLWDPKRSAEDNTKLEYGPKAATILEQCGLPVPPELRYDAMDFLQEEPNAKGAEDQQSSAAKPQSEDQQASAAKPLVNVVEAAAAAGGQKQASLMEEEEEKDVDQVIAADQSPVQSHPELQSSSVCGGNGFLCCSK